MHPATSLATGPLPRSTGKWLSRPPEAAATVVRDTASGEQTRQRCPSPSPFLQGHWEDQKCTRAHTRTHTHTHRHTHARTQLLTKVQRFLPIQFLP